MRRFTIGEENFLRDWAAFQDIHDDNEPVKRISAIVKPVNKMRVRIERFLENWVMFVGLVFMFFTVKVLAESLVRLVK